MKTCNRGYEPLAFEAIAAALGTRALSLLPVPTYPDSIVYAATTEKSSAVFKAVDPAGRDRDAIALEAWALKKATALGVPVPQVLAIDESQSIFPASYLVMARCRGVQADDQAVEGGARLEVARRVGEVLVRLHEYRMSGFGILDERHRPSVGHPRGRFASWADMLAADIHAALDYLADRALPRDQVAWMRQVAEASLVRCRMPVESRLQSLDGKRTRSGIACS